MFAAGANPQVSYLFVDGGCLEHVLKRHSERYGDGEALPIDWSVVGRFHRKTYFYDAVPVQLEQEEDAIYSARIAPKLAELAAIERTPAFHVRTGDVRKRGRRGNEQKMVDVQLAVDALLMASRGLYGTATILTGDLDFKPLVVALVEMGVDVRLLYPKGGANPDLLAAADFAEIIRPSMIGGWLVPERLPALPSPSSNLQHGVEEMAEFAIADWIEPRYGRCVVLKRGETFFELVTEKSPENPRTHNLEIIAASHALLCRYAADQFDIEVPE